MIAKEPREIEISSLLFGGYDPLRHQLQVDVACSRGTYIRVLAADIGRVLGCGAHLLELRRLGSGCFSVADSLTDQELAEADGRQKLLAAMIPVERAEALLADAAAAQEEEIAATG